MPVPIPSPSAICTVNGLPISTVNTSGINVSAGSTILVELVSSAGVNSWSIEASQADDISQIDGSLIATNNSKNLITAFKATFNMPGMASILRGRAIQFTSTVNAGEPNEDTTTFGVWVLNANGFRLFFGSESFESNATVGNAADLNSVVVDAFQAGCDLAGTNVCQTVIRVNGMPYQAIPTGSTTPFTVPGVDGAGTEVTYNFLVDANVSATAAIQGTKITPNFGHQNIIGDNLGLLVGEAQVRNIVLSPWVGSLPGTGAQIFAGNGFPPPPSAYQLRGSLYANVNTGATVDQLLYVLKGPSSLDWKRIINEDCSMFGDVRGVFFSNTVEGLWNRNLDSALATIGSGQNGYALIWNNSNNQWEAQPVIAGSVVMGGDVTGPSTSCTVVAIQGNSVVSGTVNKGNFLISPLTGQWQALDLSGDVTNSNTTPGLITVEAIQTKTLDVSLASIGAAQDGYVLTWDNPDGYWKASPTKELITWAHDLAGSTDTDQIVVGITGIGGVIDFADTARELRFDQISTLVKIKQQDSISASTGAPLLLKAQSTSVAGSVGGFLQLEGGDGVLDGGNVLLSTGNRSADFIDITLNAVTALVEIHGADNYTVAGGTTRLLQLNSSNEVVLYDPSGIVLAGDVSGTTGANTVDKLKGKNLDSALATIGAAQDGYKLTWNNSTNQWEAQAVIASSVTWSNDLAGSTDTNQIVVSLTGVSGVVNTQPGVSTLSFVTTASLGVPQNVLINQTQNLSSNPPGTFTVQAQNGAGSANGGNMFLTSGAHGTFGGNDGDLFLQVGGNTKLTVNHTGVITIANLAPGGNVKANGSGDLVIAGIVDADVNSGANIAVDKLAGGSSGQFLQTVSSVPTWTNMSADVTLASGGAATVVAIQNNAVQSGILGATQDGYVLTWVNADNQWEPLKPAEVLATGRIWEFNNSSSDIATYDNLIQSVSGTEADLSVSGVTSGSGNVLIEAFATLLGVPNINTIPQGIWDFNAYGYVDSLSGGNSFLVFNVYTRTSGGTETLILTATSDPLTTSVGVINASVNLASSVAIASTDRIVVKVYGQTAASSGKTIHFVFDGTTHVSHFHSSIVGGAIQVAGDLSGTTSDATVIALRGNSVKAESLGAANDGYVLTWNNSNTDWESTKYAGDVTGKPSASTVVAIQGNAVKSQTLGAAQDGYALTWVNANNRWEAQPETGAGGSGVTNVGTFDSQTSNANGLVIISTSIYAQSATSSNPGMIKLAGDLGNTAAAPYVVSITGTSPIPITPAELQWVNSTSSPLIDQAALASTSGASGSNGQDLSVTAQAGQAATGAAHNGGNGGNLVLSAGAGGTSGSATAGLDGYIKFKSGTVLPAATKTSDYTITYSNYHIFANFSAGHNLTLPAPLNGLTFEIWDIAGTSETNNITLVRNGSEKISGVAASRVLKTNWGHWTITSDGTDWYVG